jgi:hypothetical protein
MNCIIPTIVVDNFFDDPYDIRRYALQQEFKKDPANFYPGKRTDTLESFNPQLADYVTNKMLSIFYPGHYKFDKVVATTFQMVESDYEEGWVHKDIDDNIITGIIYLNEYMPENSGTSIYEAKQEGNTMIHNNKKSEWIKTAGNNGTDYREENNNLFKETITIQNKFNRLVAFDSHLFHKANGFVGSKKHDTRLTMVIFIRKLYSDVKDFRYPLQNMRRF